MFDVQSILAISIRLPAAAYLITPPMNPRRATNCRPPAAPTAALADFGLLPVTAGRPDGFFDNLILLLPENCRETGGRAGGGASADISQGALDYLLQTGFDKLPAAHILRLFLNPAPVLGFWILTDDLY